MITFIEAFRCCKLLFILFDNMTETKRCVIKFRQFIEKKKIVIGAQNGEIYIF